MHLTHSPNPQEVIRLLRQTDWAKERPDEIMLESLNHSLSFGLEDENGNLMAYARVVTDYVLYAYLCDVVVDEAHRGKGLSKRLMECVMAHPQLQTLRRFALITANAHELYRRYGFTEMDQPERYMEIFKPH